MTITDFHADNPMKRLLDEYRSKMLSFDQLQTVPEPTWLIDGYLMNDTVGVIWGDPSAGKSFVALDWAMSIATGTRWFRRDVAKGNVLYVLGEGVTGMKLRANAWVAAHQGLRPYDDELMFLRKPIRLLDEFAVELISQLAREQGGLAMIVIDTLARALVGHSENDSTDMGRLVDVAEQVREVTTATVLFVHHSNKSATKAMRGSSALKGAVDTEIEMEHNEENGERQLHCRKQKDAAPFMAQPVYLQPHASSLVPSHCHIGGF